MTSVWLVKKLARSWLLSKLQLIVRLLTDDFVGAGRGTGVAVGLSRVLGVEVGEIPLDVHVVPATVHAEMINVKAIRVETIKFIFTTSSSYHFRIKCITEGITNQIKSQNEQ